MAKAIPILPLLICIVLVVQPAPHCAISFSPDFNPIDLGLKNRPMEGIALRCCIVMEQPYVVIDASEYIGYKGWAILQFSKLQELSGMTCESLEVFKADNGSQHNGFVTMLAKCTNRKGLVRRDSMCKCDIGIGAWWETSNRTGVDFLTPYGHSGIGVVVHVDSTRSKHNQFFFIQAFAPSVWISIAALGIAFTILKFMDARFVPKSPEAVTSSEVIPVVRETWPQWALSCLKKIPFFRVKRACQDTAQRMAGVPGPEWQRGVSSSRNWVLNCVIATCGLIFILTYEAKMTALMVGEGFESDYKSVKDFKSCKISHSDVCIPKGGGIEVYWNNTVSTAPCARGSNRYPRRMSYNELIESTQNKDCKYTVMGGGLASLVSVGNYCRTLVAVGEPFLVRGLSFVIPPNWIHQQDLQNVALKAQQGQLVPSLETYIDSLGRCEAVHNHRMTVKMLYVFFIFVISVCVILLLDIFCGS